MKLGPFNRYGTGWSSTPPHLYIAFTIGDTNFRLEEESESVWVEDTSHDAPVLASYQDRAAVLALWKEDQEIQTARSSHAKALSEGNKALEKVLYGSIWFNDGDPTICEFDQHPGIKWAQVGRNASHNFFLGADEDGQSYYRSTYYDGESEEECVELIDGSKDYYLGHG